MALPLPRNLVMIVAMKCVRWAGDFLGITAGAAVLASGASRSAAQDESIRLFTNGSIPRLRLTIPAESIARLRAQPRQDVSAVVREGTNEWPAVGVHLKGSVGSFRGIDGKPAL